MTANPCPAGATLTTMGTWHNKKGEANETSYRFKTYRTEAYTICPLKNKCTKLPKRIVQRSEPACRQVGTRMQQTQTITTSNKTRTITSEGRPFVSIPLAV